MLHLCQKLKRRLPGGYVILTSSYLDVSGMYDDSNEQIKLHHSYIWDKWIMEARRFGWGWGGHGSLVNWYVDIRGCLLDGANVRRAMDGQRRECCAFSERTGRPSFLGCSTGRSRTLESGWQRSTRQCIHISCVTLLFFLRYLADQARSIGDMHSNRTDCS